MFNHKPLSQDEYDKHQEELKKNAAEYDKKHENDAGVEDTRVTPELIEEQVKSKRMKL